MRGISEELIGFAFFVFLVYGIVTLSNIETTNDFKKAAIEKGFAHHNSQTGKWEWKKSCETSVEIEE